MPLTLTSPSFAHNEAIPTRHTCDGTDVSPALQWAGVPDSAYSLALIVDDPDAPDPRAPKRTWVHWVLYNLPPDTHELPEGIKTAQLPGDTSEGLNDWQRYGYGGPCPPIGRHRYFFRLYALDVMLPLLTTPTKAALLDAMKGHVLATAELVGTYKKQG